LSSIRARSSARILSGKYWNDWQEVQVTRMSGGLTLEIGYRVAWDEEHTLGARIQDGRLVGLSGSVLRP
jgi:hypothetical protein